ncbi:MAG: type II toxin-antitoxin system RelE/ParE family toxin [Desulfobacterales bacterium]|nr:type II toxin-antitoxin system RelE/ParE family toxin [Desulfobacterales bacterium]
MIQKFKHKGLRRLFESGHTLGVKPQHVERLRRILALLETAETIDDMDLPGLNLHELKGKRKGIWAVKVSGNWRVTFNLKNGDVFNVNYEDYH